MIMEYTIVGVGQFFDFESKEHKDTLQVRVPTGEVFHVETSNACVHELIRLASGLPPASGEAPEESFPEEDVEPSVFGGYPDSFGDDDDEESPEGIADFRESLKRAHSEDFSLRNQNAIIARLEEAKAVKEQEDLDGDEDRQI